LSIFRYHRPLIVFHCIFHLRGMYFCLWAKLKEQDSAEGFIHAEDGQDSVIKRESLVHRWIAEGFIHAEDLMEVGETYFHELVNRSLIQSVEIGFDGKAQACRVHSTIRDFLTSREDNFCHFVSNYSNHTHFPVAKVRWISIMANNEGDVNISLNLIVSHIRTLGVFRAKRLPSFLDFSALRVLSLTGCYELGGSDVVNTGNLFQLRYLDISSTEISELLL
jgi:hypothetical protein